MQTILIIEDEILVAKGIEQALSNNGYCVCGIAKNYEQVKLLLLTCSPDLILCDIDLNEEKTGVDIVEELLKRRKLPFVFISAYSDEVTLSKAFDSKPITYITKPFTEIQLLTTVKFAIQDTNQDNNIELDKITNKERQIIKLLASGLTTREIAKINNRSYETINNHKRNIFSKLDIHKVSELVNFAIENGLN